jgi:hypothetical protein
MSREEKHRHNRRDQQQEIHFHAQNPQKIREYRRQNQRDRQSEIADEKGETDRKSDHPSIYQERNILLQQDTTRRPRQNILANYVPTRTLLNTVGSNFPQNPDIFSSHAFSFTTITQRVHGQGAEPSGNPRPEVKLAERTHQTRHGLKETSGDNFF